MQEWGDWAEPVPLVEAGPVTESTHEIRLRVVPVGHGVEASPIRWRPSAVSSWQTGRLAAWARPTGTEAWSVLALTYLTKRYPARDPHHTWSGHPCWRTAWVVYDRDLVEPVESSGRYPSDFWRDELSRALADFAGSNGAGDGASNGAR